MGFGAYSHAAHTAISRRRSKSSRGSIFKQRVCHPTMRPHGIELREARDSPTHPDSVGVVFALDVSGSMGKIPHRLATTTLPAFMKATLDCGVTDPQILFLAIGHAVSDRAPLQIGQFESGEREMDTWLTRLFLEGGGGGGHESYELAMYFAARHTAMDCWEKRQRKGYFFVTGDEPPNEVVDKAHVKRLLGVDLKSNISLPDIISELKRSFEPFYLIPDPGRASTIEARWRELLGDRVIVLPNPEATCYAAAGLIALIEGAVSNLAELQDRLAAAGVPKDRVGGVGEALAGFARSRARGHR